MLDSKWHATLIAALSVLLAVHATIGKNTRTELNDTNERLAGAWKLAADANVRAAILEDEVRVIKETLQLSAASGEDK